jgi:hypothetical protein
MFFFQNIFMIFKLKFLNLFYKIIKTINKFKIKNSETLILAKLVRFIIMHNVIVIFQIN